jgi:hypothetical protein
MKEHRLLAKGAAAFEDLHYEAAGNGMQSKAQRCGRSLLVRARWGKKHR